MENGSITHYTVKNIACIILRIYPEDDLVKICYYDVDHKVISLVHIDTLLIPRVIPHLTQQFQLFRLYSYFLWRRGIWYHVRFVKYGYNNTGVMSNRGEIWSGYNINEL